MGNSPNEVEDYIEQLKSMYSAKVQQCSDNSPSKDSESEVVVSMNRHTDSDNEVDDGQGWL